MSATRRYHIVLIAGDGIGPEVTAAALQVLAAASATFGFDRLHSFARSSSRSAPSIRISRKRRCTSTPLPRRSCSVRVISA